MEEEKMFEQLKLKLKLKPGDTRMMLSIGANG